MLGFKGHKSVYENKKNKLVIYLDINSEFARFVETVDSEKQITLYDNIKKYIAENVSKTKYHEVLISVGSLVVATIDLDTINESNNEYVGMFKPFFKNNDYFKIIHVVKKDETLSSIAKMYNIKESEINDLNSCDANTPYQDKNIIISNKTLPTTKVKQNLNSEEIKSIQRALLSMGYDVCVDGVYNESTRISILNFQKRYPYYNVDGVYNELTGNNIMKDIGKGFSIINDKIDKTTMVNKNRSLRYDYVPDKLVMPNIKFILEGNCEKYMMESEASQYIELLFNKAYEEDVKIVAISAYRSFDRQYKIYKRNVDFYNGANNWSAKPGESEHQTGYAMDVSCEDISFKLNEQFAYTKEGIWIKKNAHKFGYIVRYPLEKELITGYQYEPWHIRYVGTEIAGELFEKNITLEEYYKYHFKI